VSGTDNERQPVTRDRLLNQVVGIDAALHEAEISGAVLNGLGHLGGVARDEVDRDARVRPPAGG
jgi:hypothetical protein